MLHSGDHDLIAGLEIMANAARQMERQAGHGLPDDHLGTRFRAQHQRHVVMRPGPDAVGLAAGHEGAAGVGIVVNEIVADRVDHQFGHLRARRIVQITARGTIVGLRQRWEHGAHFVNRKSHGQYPHCRAGGIWVSFRSALQQTYHPKG